MVCFGFGMKLASSSNGHKPTAVRILDRTYFRCSSYSPVSIRNPPRIHTHQADVIYMYRNIKVAIDSVYRAEEISGRDWRSSCHPMPYIILFLVIAGINCHYIPQIISQIVIIIETPNEFLLRGVGSNIYLRISVLTIFGVEYWRLCLWWILLMRLFMKNY